MYGWAVIERMIPTLPCRELDDVQPFYEALGFTVTYRDARPSPYLCLQRGEHDLHFFAMAGFEPADSYSMVIVLAGDTGALYEEFAAGLRAAYGKVPISGIPRITRPRRKQGTSAGFSVVDPGGNWLRIHSTQGVEDTADGPRASQLDRVLLNATRQGDSRGDERRAISVLEAGLLRHAEATPVERVPVLAYLAELLVRVGEHDQARAVLADIATLELDEDARASMATELAAVAELERDLR